VECDEAVLFTRKNNRGRILRGEDCWIFGGISRASGRRFAMRVDRRNMETLNGEILDSIRPQSIICTDGWLGYNGINRMVDVNGQNIYAGHYVVIHERNFVEPPRGEEPFWRSDILPECRDMQYIGPYPVDPQTGNQMLPFRVHTQKVERGWLQLRKDVKSTRWPEAIDRYIGMTINVLASILMFNCFLLFQGAIFTWRTSTSSWVDQKASVFSVYCKTFAGCTQDRTGLP
jgi:hypothetical protein